MGGDPCGGGEGSEALGDGELAPGLSPLQDCRPRPLAWGVGLGWSPRRDPHPTQMGMACPVCPVMLDEGSGNTRCGSPSSAGWADTKALLLLCPQVLGP